MFLMVYMIDFDLDNFYGVVHYVDIFTSS